MEQGIEQTNQEKQTPAMVESTPGFLKFLVVLTYIFSVFFSLIYLLGVFASSLWISMIPNLPSDIPAGGVLVGIVIVTCLIMIGFEILTMIGASKMWKLKKSGFWMWIIPNGILLLLLLISLGNATVGTYIALGVTLFMFIGYIANFKHLK